jgi:hypothetical protein
VPYRHVPPFSRRAAPPVLAIGQFAIDPRTVAKMLAFSVPPGIGGADRRRVRSSTRTACSAVNISAISLHPIGVVASIRAPRGGEHAIGQERHDRTGVSIRAPARGRTRSAAPCGAAPRRSPASPAPFGPDRP